MRRRKALQAGCAVVAATLVGCLGNESNESNEYRTQGDDDDPFDVDASALLLPKDRIQEVLDPGWVEEAVEEEAQNEGMFLDVDAAIQYVPYDETDGEFHMESGNVTCGVWLYQDVETAQETFGDHPYQDGWGFEAYEIASECIAGTHETDYDYGVLFRDANAIGGLLYNNSHDTDALESNGLGLAVQMHESWRDE